MNGSLKSRLRWRCAVLLCAAILLRALQAFLPTAQSAPPPASQHAAQQTDKAAEPDEPDADDASARPFTLPPLRLRDLPQKEPAQNAAQSESESEPAQEQAQDEPSGQAETAQPVQTQDQTPLQFSAEEAQSLSIRGGCTLPYDKAALLQAPLAPLSMGQEPEILILHTHGTEAYTPADGESYEETDLCHTLQAEQSVIEVGRRLTQRLQEAGFCVLHDETLCDYPSYNGSYERSAEIAQQYLAKYPSIRVVLDLHRDAFQLPDGSLAASAEDGCAKVLLICGTNQSGLTHPGWQDNLSFALKIQALAARQDPALLRPLQLSTQRYNGHLTPMSLLCEFGSAGDTLSEVLAAADRFASLLTPLLRQGAE